MLRFTNWTGALLFASALTTLTMNADAQNRRPQGRAAPAVRTMGPPVRSGASFVRPVAPFVRHAVPAPAPRFVPQIAMPRAPAPRAPSAPIGGPGIAAPTDASRYVVPPKPGASVSSLSSIRREIGEGSTNPAGRPGLTSRISVRRVPDGAEIVGRTQIDNHAAIIRGSVPAQSSLCPAIAGQRRCGEPGKDDVSRPVGRSATAVETSHGRDRLDRATVLAFRL